MAIESKRVYELAKEYGMSNKDFIEYTSEKIKYLKLIISIKNYRL